jgi:hypothetical protein
MKKLAVIAMALISCSQPTERDPYRPVRPIGVPETTCDGTPIEWNWKKMRAYEEGRLTLVKSDSGCVIAVVLKCDAENF